MVYLSAEKISFSYPQTLNSIFSNIPPKYIFNNSTISLVAGESVAITGKNGCGKSTLLRLLMGIYQPTEGKVLHEGTIGGILNLGAGINQELSGKDNAILRSKFHNMAHEKMDEYLDKIQSDTGLGTHFNQPCYTYSQGMLARLNFSIVSQFYFDILLMDEWIAVGDQQFRKKAELRIEKLINKSKIFIFASHSHDLIQMCEREIDIESI